MGKLQYGGTYVPCAFMAQTKVIFYPFSTLAAILATLLAPVGAKTFGCLVGIVERPLSSRLYILSAENLY